MSLIPMSLRPGPDHNDRMERISLPTRAVWQQVATRPVAVTAQDLFGALIKDGYSDAIAGVLGPSEFSVLERVVNEKLLSGRSVGIAGAGTFGLTIALGCAAAGADVTLYSSSSLAAPTAMSRALGIGEPQGIAVEHYFRATLPLFDKLIEIGAPIRRDRVVYYYGDETDKSLVDQLSRMPGANPIVESANEFGCRNRLTFNGYIFSPAGIRETYFSALRASGKVTLVDRHFDDIAPIGRDAELGPHDISFFALGQGRGELPGADIPGNRGQMFYIEGDVLPELIQNHTRLGKGVGSIGIPQPTGSVNIVLQYDQGADGSLNPVLLVGATKKPRCSDQVPNKGDYDFLLNGVKTLWPELYEELRGSERQRVDSTRLKFGTYVCVRPGGGEPFTIEETNGCIDVRAAGGAGNSIAGGAALKALSLGFNRLLAS